MKYTIEVRFKSGQMHSLQAEAITFHPGTGGIDIFENKRIPFFPGREESIMEIRIILNENMK